MSDLEFTYSGRATVDSARAAVSSPGPVARALKGVSFSLHAGELAVLSGRNGAGKSTLALTLNGTIPHLIRGDFAGMVKIAGHEIETPRSHVSEIGVVFQDFEAHLVASTCALEAAFPLENVGVSVEDQRRRVREVLSVVGLSGFDGRFPAELSGGEKQRLAIAAAIALNPGLLVLDEPLTDLDPAGKVTLLGIVSRLKATGVSVLMIEHDPQAMLMADRLLVLDSGRLVYDGRAEELAADPVRCREMGVPVWPPAEVALKLGIRGNPLGVAEVADRIRAAFPERLRSVSGGPKIQRRPPEHGPGSGPLLEIRNLNSGYSKGTDCLHDVDFVVNRGECVALLGQNGSGKTALARHVVGLVKPRSGEIFVAGRPVTQYSLAALSRIVGYVFQNPDHQIFSDTVLDEVCFGVRNLGLSGESVLDRAREALSAVGLEGAGRADPFSLTRGERQRLAVASLLAYRPEAIFFDEPTTGLDAEEAEHMMEFIGELNRDGMTVILITHAMWAAAACAQRAVVLSVGRVALEGPVREVFARERDLEPLSLRPPPAAELANRLGISALNVSELAALLEGGS